MKKSLFIFLAFIHLFTVVGFSMNVHYCMGKVSVSVLGIDIHKSCKCKHDEKKHSKKCCNNKEVNIKGDYSKNKTSTNSIEFSKDFGIDVFVLLSNTTYYMVELVTPIIVTNNGSPPNHAPPLYLMNGVFLI